MKSILYSLYLDQSVMLTNFTLYYCTCFLKYTFFENSDDIEVYFWVVEMGKFANWPFWHRNVMFSHIFINNLSAIHSCLQYISSIGIFSVYCKYSIWWVYNAEGLILMYICVLSHTRIRIRFSCHNLALVFAGCS